MGEKKFSQYLYEIENWVDEFTIAFLSFGTIVVLIYTLFFSTAGYKFTELGLIIEPWITMLALMIIARELWIMNMRETRKLEGEE